MTTIIPTMHISEPTLDDPREMIVYVIRHFTSIPSGVSNTFTNQEISFQKLRAQYGFDGKSLASAVSKELNTVLKRIFKDGIVTVDCKAKTIKDTSRYNLDLAIQLIKNNEQVNIAGVLDVPKSGQVSIQFNSGV